MTFKRYAENFRNNNYAEWILRREGMKAYHDKVEPYIERDISKIEVGDVLVADGHVLNFQVINPFTGKATRATLVKDMEEYNRQYKKQQQIKNRLVKKLRAIYPKEELRLLEIESEESNEVLKIEEMQEKDNIQNSKEKPKTIRKRKLTPRERQMNAPIFQSDCEKYEWLMSNGTTNPDDRLWLANYI